MAASDDDNFVDGLLIGAVVGTLVGGLLGFMLAPRRRPAVLGDSTLGTVEGDAPAPSGRSLDDARRVLEEKIAQLNRAIDETRSRLGAAPPAEPPPPQTQPEP